MVELCEAIKTQDAVAARRWSKGEQWSTVVQLMQAANGEKIAHISVGQIVSFPFACVSGVGMEGCVCVVSCITHECTAQFPT